jgi:hypothetical protein
MKATTDQVITDMGSIDRAAEPPRTIGDVTSTTLAAATCSAHRS